MLKHEKQFNHNKNPSSEKISKFMAHIADTKELMEQKPIGSLIDIKISFDKNEKACFRAKKIFKVDICTFCESRGDILAKCLLTLNLNQKNSEPKYSSFLRI